ncbi:MAG: hypothetical protein IJ439_00950 [Tyzzerella sp.]|nr:hypothetical protein [Tyzzerella sp.]
MIDETTQLEIEETVKRAIAEAVKDEKKQRRQQILYNTRILMESYIEMRKHIENAISEAEEMEDDAFQIFKSEDAHLESIRRSKLKTALMIANIDKAMQELDEEQKKIGTSYKYEAFKMHYIDGIPYEEISDRLNCGKNTPARWSKEMIRKMSVKLFGIDGIEKW